MTDKRIIRYFMTIPEAAQLVLEAGAMAKQSEIFVLDMGEPVKILNWPAPRRDLEKTGNGMIFVEHQPPVTPEELERKLTLIE